MKAKLTYEELEKENKILRQKINETSVKEFKSLIEKLKAQNKGLITAKETAEKSEEKYTTLFNRASIGILIADITNMHFSFANPAICKMLGYTEDELLKMKVMDIHPKDSLELVISEFQAQARKEKTLATNLPCLKKDGSIIYTNINTTSFTLNDTEYNVGFFTDITKERESDLKIKKQKEEYASLNEEYKTQNEELIKTNKKAEDNEAKFKAITNQTTEGITVADTEGNYVFINSAFCKMSGYSKEELLKMTVFDMKAETQDYTSFNDSKSFMEGKPLRVNLKKKTGQEYIAEVIGKKIKIDNKQLILGTVRNITERVETEKEINKLLMAVEQSANSIVITDTKGLIEYTNSKFSEVSGYSKEDVLKKNVSILKAGTQTKEYYTELWKTITTGEIWKGEFHNKTKSGDSLWEKVSITPLKDDFGEIINYIAIKEDITAGKKAEKQLSLANEIIKENEIYLSSILKTANEGFWIIDTTTTTLEVNQEMCKILGIKKEEIIGKSIFEFVDEKNSKIFKNQIEQRAKGASSNYEIDLLTKRGDNITCLFKATPIFNSEKERIGSFAMVTDISKLKSAYKILEAKNKELIAAKEKAEEGEIKFRNFANLLPQIVYECDLNGNLIFVNEQALDYFGYSQEQFNKGLNILQTVIPDDRDRVTKNIQKIFDGNVIKNSEYTALKSTGETFPVLIYASSVLKNNLPVGLRGIIVDITERKKAEKQLKQSEKNYRDLFNKATDAIYIQDKTGYFIDVNQGAINMYGYPKELIIGKNSDFLSAPGKNDLKKIAQYVEKAYNGEAQQFDFWGIRKNGEVFPKTVRSQAGIYMGEKAIISFSIDISERKKIESELIESKEKAEESDRLKTEFINNMSHEIRTPMNGIIGFSQLLSTPDISNEKLNNYISIIQNSGNQLMRIIDDILEISKLGTKQVKAIEHEVCLNDLLFEMFSIFDIKAKENKTPLYLKKGGSDEESTILTDESKLSKILSNLLENALKFTNIGYIEFGYKIINSKIKIYVKDTGIGIRPEKQNSIFERFSQADKEVSIQVGGLGLGLSIAKENVELMGGEITLKSEKDKGSTFVIIIPYKPVSLSGSNNRKGKKSSLFKKPKTILIAEDEEINFIYIETLLESFDLNNNILHARNGKDAVKICKGNIDIDLILMDVKMPIMNGYDATKLIKKDCPDIPIIAQTAYTTPEHINESKSAGCDDFITKPIKKETLYNIINKYIEY